MGCLYSKTLNDVPSDKGFWFCNGTRAMNLYQLVDGIEHTSDDIFEYHDHGEKNDFAAWILDVLGDEELFALVRREESKYWFVQKVRHRIKELEEQATQRILEG